MLAALGWPCPILLSYMRLMRASACRFQLSDSSGCVSL